MIKIEDYTKEDFFKMINILNSVKHLAFDANNYQIVIKTLSNFGELYPISKESTDFLIEDFKEHKMSEFFFDLGQLHKECVMYYRNNAIKKETAAST